MRVWLPSIILKSFQLEGRIHSWPPAPLLAVPPETTGWGGSGRPLSVPSPLPSLSVSPVFPGVRPPARQFLSIPLCPLFSPSPPSSALLPPSLPLICSALLFLPLSHPPSSAPLSSSLPSLAPRVLLGPSSAFDRAQSFTLRTPSLPTHHDHPLFRVRATPAPDCDGYCGILSQPKSLIDSQPGILVVQVDTRRNGKRGRQGRSRRCGPVRGARSAHLQSKRRGFPRHDRRGRTAGWHGRRRQ